METHSWHFPLPRTHTGILQGNGTFGAMIWGGDHTLKITLNRADFWDHRGGMPWTEGMSYRAIRCCLEARDEAGLRQLFERGPVPKGEPRRPTMLPLGRLELDFGENSRIKKGTLSFADATVVIAIERGGCDHRLRLTMLMDRPVLLLEYLDRLRPVAIRCITAWDYVGEYLASVAFEKPFLLQGDPGALRGWVQERPADAPLCVGYREALGCLAVTAVYGADVARARHEAEEVLSGTFAEGATRLRRANAAWWEGYWQNTPVLDIPNERLAFLYRYGMYKFAGLTAPQGVPATLQGPWVEEYQMPPWSSDYHFNINVQECYWPAYRGNRLSHLKPLFDMVLSWEEKLRHNAKVFLGIDDGLMLPHAVDDRGTCMGGFWTGSVDHGCTAWIAAMMFQYYLYSGDSEFLRQAAYPFMVGAMRVYEEMLEGDGDSLVLPVSVSPEYRGSSLNAWGQNASFQLACIHYLCEKLLAASQVLGLEPRPVWHEIREKLPKACIMGAQPEIYLWEGTPLEESHRHHSHLAGIYPFDVIDIDDPQWQAVTRNSLQRWISKGMGQWSGWCMPWAAIIHTRFGNSRAAELLLELWERVFTNEGHGTLHDGMFPGFTLIGCGPLQGPDLAYEKMQMDAGMGATAAVMEMMLHTRRGVNHLFAGAPPHWKDVSFSGIRTEGAFLIGARREGGYVTEVTVQSEEGGTLCLQNPWREGTLSIPMRPGEQVSLRP